MRPAAPVALTDQFLHALAAVDGLSLTRGAPLAAYTRFGLGGPAAILGETADAACLARALAVARESGAPVAVIGGGTNLIVSDEGFPGVVLRFRSGRIVAAGTRIEADAGADLDALVRFTVDRGLKGLETLARIPGWVGGAVHGNAGAYGHSISETVASVTVTDGREQRILAAAECGFGYRDSVFKRRKEWVILSVALVLEEGDAKALTKVSDDIRSVRDRKFPPEMKCAGSIFKNLLLAELPRTAAAQVPENVIREGKVPAAWFLEQAGARGMSRGGIRVADYHANLIYNAGGGTARDLCALIAALKSRVGNRFGITLEEEVQYVGFEERGGGGNGKSRPIPT
ncbi:MAG: UDP-N-acetylmuramate dehydrogenase [Bryobacteraceae bacterium]